ncbi:hypothetical protein [Flavobacterium panici]|uniref:Restriction endonuclease type IV Mrr domain-containing protein n=1 Tax=Flavobacterium panici TaxID=2654843 RepID=A0A9N8J2V3_9FLAO|nr:hypothetical protein [Flavobacterium panici]CAC9974384.1 hypothetical protein FLAPXU55_02081 [Flavobacterium panici]
MTETRKYFEKLVSNFDALCKIQNDEIIRFVQLKNQLFALLIEISNYKLLEIEMPKLCLDIAESEDCKDLVEEQRILAVNLADQLCSLLIGKIWYGGEILYHLNRLTISAYHLPKQIQEEINRLDGEKVDGLQFRIRLRNIEDPSDTIKNLIEKNNENINSTEGKCKKIEHTVYLDLKEQLDKKVSFYRSYIIEHYPLAANYFSFSGKCIKAYLCDERKELVVCRIQSYEDPTDTSVHLYEQILDFIPRPPYNCEKIDKQISSWSWFGINKSDWKISDQNFSKEFIHRELLTIYLAHAGENELVEFVKFFIKNRNLQVKFNVEENTFLSIEGDSTYNYLKIFNKKEINETDLESTLEKLNNYSSKYNKQVMFTSKPDNIVIEYFEKNHVKVRYIKDLTDLYFENDHSELIHLFIKSRLNLISFGVPNEINEGKLLINELRNCPRGKAGWPNYEKIGAEVFKFLFADSFAPYIAETQASNSADTLRRDLVVHNSFQSTSTFWSRINVDFKAKLLIVEFKNYKDEFDYDTMHSTTKYLSGKTGNFILIFSRLGGKQSIQDQQKEQLREGKLIITFNDIELIEMIEEKINGRNPLYRLDLKYFSLLKK